MKEESMADSKQKTHPRLTDQSNIIRPASRTVKAREIGVVETQTAKDKKSRAKQSESNNKKGVNNASLVFGKVETAMGLQNGPQVPFLDISEEESILTNKKSSATSTGSRPGSKLLANETYSRVKRSLIGDFPRIHHAAQVHPRPPDSTELLELRQLRTLVQELRDREAKLQSELLQCKGFRESSIRVSELDKEVCAQKAEASKFRQRIEQLEAEKCKMAEQLAHYPVLEKEVEEARAKVKEFQNHMLSESRHAEDILQQCITSTENKLKVLEVELMELRRSNMELKHQKRDLASKLAAAEAQVATLGKLTESDIIAKVEAEASKLRHTNENLCKQVEGLQMNRFSEVEELVYLRWVNSCLRYELRNSDAAAGRASALDLKDTPSPKSQDVAKQLMVEYATSEQSNSQGKPNPSENDVESVSSSKTSDAADFEDSLTEGLSSRFSLSRRSSLIGKLRKWTKTSDDWQLAASEQSSEKRSESAQNARISPRRRHSISGPKESVQQIRLHNRRESGSANRLNIGRASLDSSTAALPKIQPGALTNPLMPKANLPEQKNDVASSFHLITKTVSNELEDKYPAFKDRHKLLLPKTEGGAIAKLDAADEGTNQKTLSVSTHTDKSVAIPADAERRVLRIHKPPPKPSEMASLNNTCSNSESKSSSLSLPAPPPPPPPPAKPAYGTKGANPPPPPLPPPPKFLQSSSNTVRRAPQVVEFYQSLMKRDVKKDSCGAGVADAPNMTNAHSSMIGEIENRSSHLLAIKADVETQGDFVRSLIREVKGATYNNIEDVLAFVKWLDDELSFLVDERAVLKHFDWPERKADAMREAAFGYRDLKKLEVEVSSYECNRRQPCAAALKKMSSLLEKCEQVVYNLLRTRDLAMPRYKEFQIPTDWMLDTGIVSKIKLASVKLAKKYMERVATELESLKCSEKEPEREFLLLQGVRFAFRAHQFAGGFDAESMQAFEELRNLAHRSHSNS